MSTEKRESRSLGLIIGAFTLVYLIGIGVIVLATAAWGGGGSGSGSGSGSDESILNISLSEFAIKGDLNATPGKIMINITNDGSVAHDFQIADLGILTDKIAPGVSTTVVIEDAAAGSYEIICTVAGHKESGMTATLTVGESGGSASGGSSSHDHTSLTPEEAQARDDNMMAGMMSFGTDEAATEGRGNTPAEFTIAADGAKEFELTAAITKWEVETGKFVDAWTYNGQVPGPWFKVDVGDRVRIKVTNNLPLGTDIHWHGIHLPNEMDGVAPYTQDPIAPNGGTFTYEFTADTRNNGMYHAHMHGEEAVPNGMLGVFQVGDVELPRGRTVSGINVPNDVNIVQEIPMVLNDAGAIGYSLNGKSFPSTEPVVVNKDDWFLVTYFNEGLQVHPMHMHGFPQLVVARDGITLDQPFWVDTITVGPGERYSILVKATDLGTWVWHCHILNHVETPERMFGMATAVVVQDPAAA